MDIEVHKIVLMVFILLLMDIFTNITIKQLRKGFNPSTEIVFIIALTISLAMIIFTYVM